MRISDWSSDVCSSDLPKDVGRRLDAKDVRYIGDNRKMSVVTSAAAFLLIGTQPEEIGVVHQNEPLVRTAQAQAASAEPCPMIVDSQGEVQPPIMIGERPVEARSEEHPSELQSLMRNSYSVFCLKNK